MDKFIFPPDFIVLDFETDREVPTILRRPFLATGRTLIDVQKGELTMRVNDEQVTLAMRFPDELEECSTLSVIDLIVSNELEKFCYMDPFELSLLSKVAEENKEVLKQLAWLDAIAKYITR